MVAVQAASEAMDPSNGAEKTLKLENVRHSPVRELSYRELTSSNLD